MTLSFESQSSWVSVLCHEVGSQLALVVGQNIPKYPHIEEVRTLGFGLDLLLPHKGQFQLVTAGQQNPTFSHSVIHTGQDRKSVV